MAERSSRTSDPLLLIDADVFAYKAAAGAEKPIIFEDGWVFPGCNLYDAESAFWGLVYAVLEQLDASLEHCIFCFSTDHNGGFRRGVLPSYKANRDGKPRPIGLKPLREKLMNEILPEAQVYIREGLEADDCLGILATRNKFHPDKQKIIVSVDKDMKTLPGYFYNMGHPEEGVLFVSEADADRWFFMQVLMGDATDGYTGCPGVGPKGAEKALADCTTPEEMWSAVVKAYEKAGLGEAEAITQARVARILRASDYDFKNKSVKLWSPNYETALH